MYAQYRCTDKSSDIESSAVPCSFHGRSCIPVLQSFSDVAASTAHLSVAPAWVPAAKNTLQEATQQVGAWVAISHIDTVDTMRLYVMTNTWY